MNWVLTIRITRKGSDYGLKQPFVTNTMQQFLSADHEWTATIGCATHNTIWISQAVPYHAKLRILHGELQIQAEKKLTLEWQEKNRLLTKGEILTIPLSSMVQECSLKIKDTSVVILVQPDVDIWDIQHESYQSLQARYGALLKIGADSYTWLYQSVTNPAIMIKLLKPQHQHIEIASQFELLLQEMLQNIKSYRPKVLDMVQDEKIKLFAGIWETGIGTLLQTELALRRFIKSPIKLARQLLEWCIQQPFALSTIHLNTIWILSHDVKVQRLDMGAPWENLSPLAGWSAPEQWQQGGFSSQQSSIFTWGILLYHLLVGHAPFPTTQPEYLTSIQNNSLEFPTLHTMQPNYQKLLTQCLSAESNQRPNFDTILQILDGLEEIADDAAFGLDADFKTGAEDPDDTSSIRHMPEASQVFSNPTTSSPNKQPFVISSNMLLEPTVRRLPDQTPTNKKPTDQIPVVKKTTSPMPAVKKPTDQIPAVKKPTDQIPAIKSANEIVIKPEPIGSQPLSIMPISQLAQDQTPIDDISARTPTDALQPSHKTPNDLPRSHSAPEMVAKKSVEQATPLIPTTSVPATIQPNIPNSPSDSSFLPPDADAFVKVADIHVPVENRQEEPQNQLAKISKTKTRTNGLAPQDWDAQNNEETPIKREGQEEKPIFLSNKLAAMVGNERFLIGLLVIALLLTTILVFILWNINSNKKTTQEWRENVQLIHTELDKNYQDRIGMLPRYLDSEGLTQETQKIEQQLLEEMRNRYQREYATRFASELLPKQRQLAQTTHDPNDQIALRSLLQKIVSLYPDENERRPYRLELLTLQGADPQTLDRPAPISLNIVPEQAKNYLYCFVELPDGYKYLQPVDPQTGKIMSWPDHVAKRIRHHTEFLRCQNLLWEAAMQLLNQHFEGAKNSLIRCIEIHPDYLEPYFMLCCLYRQAAMKEMVGETAYEVWQKRGLDLISRVSIPEQDKQILKEKFKLDFIQRISDLYSILPQRNYREKLDYLIRIMALPNRNSILQSGDLFLTIDGVSILAADNIPAIIKQKTSVVCQILRNGNLMKLDVPTSDLNDPDFYTMEQPPIFYISNNQPLGYIGGENLYDLPTNMIDSIQTHEYQIQSKTMSLMPGSYLLVSFAPGHFPVRFPFIVDREAVLGKPSGQPILLHLPPKPQNISDFLQDFVLIPSGFHKGNSEDQNTRGFLMARHEVTFGQWLEYLKSIHGPGNWKLEKLQGKMPLLPSGKSFFYIRNNELVLRYGYLDWPVVGVTYLQIKEYLAWLNNNLPATLKQQNLKIRLPSADEWGVAFQGADERKYPWGQYPNPKFAKLAAAKPYWADLEPTHRNNAAFILDESPFGVHDLAGSVSEYTSTQKIVGNTRFYVIKGSGWNDPQLGDVESWSYAATNSSRPNRGIRLCMGADPLYETASSDK